VEMIEDVEMRILAPVETFTIPELVIVRLVAA